MKKSDRQLLALEKQIINATESLDWKIIYQFLIELDGLSNRCAEKQLELVTICAYELRKIS